MEYVMSNVPKLRFKEFSGGWEEKLFDKIATFSKGKGISKTDIDENGSTECIRYGELYTKYNELIQNIISKTNIHKKDLVLSEYGDIIIPASGETQIDIATASCVLKDNVALGGDLNIIKTKEDGVFLSYYLNNAKKFDIARLSQGISVVHLYSSQLKTLKLNLPSKQEQEKIASFLTSVDTKIEQLTRKEKLLQQYKKGVMQKIFNQEIRFKADDGSEFEEWEEKKLGKVFNSIKGQGLSKADIIDNGTNKCILYGELYTTYQEIIKKVISKTNSNKGIKSLKGDLLVPCSTTTTRIDLADVTVLNEENVLLGGDITILRFINKGNATYFAYYLTHHKKYDLAKYGQGSTIVHMYYSHFKDMKIKYPSSIEEQTKIANFLSSIDSKIEQVQQQLNSTKEFKKALLQQMFV
jgi:type I restriction enzyme, S subunit